MKPHLKSWLITLSIVLFVSGTAAALSGSGKGQGWLELLGLRSSNPCRAGKVCVYPSSVDGKAHFVDTAGNDVAAGSGGGASLGNFSFSGSIFNLPANASMTGASSAANTVGGTVTTNVADGASSVGLAINNTTPFSSTNGKILSLRNGGVEEIYFGQPAANGYWEMRTGVNGGVRNSSGSGWVWAAGETDGYAAGTPVVSLLSGIWRPFLDDGATLGDPSHRWSVGYIGAPVSDQPTCDATTRGGHMTVFAASGASDTVQECMKSAADTYAWRTIYTAP